MTYTIFVLPSVSICSTDFESMSEMSFCRLLDGRRDLTDTINPLTLRRMYLYSRVRDCVIGAMDSEGREGESERGFGRDGERSRWIGRERERETQGKRGRHREGGNGGGGQ